jgi:O-acetyl-ADP-ribose deacetylase (regulator of RNase III)
LAFTIYIYFSARPLSHKKVATPGLARKMRVVSPDTLRASWRTNSGLRVSLHLTPCIVTSPPGNVRGALANAANERLQGTAFTPSQCSRRLLGNTIVYPPQTVDGLVHELGGAALAADLLLVPPAKVQKAPRAGADNLPDLVRCVTGGAVVTKAFGELLTCYTNIVHACAPFYDDDNWQQRLRSCYHATLDVSEMAGISQLALPLLGAGARGAPVAHASRVAAGAIASWSGRGVLQDARFGVQEEDVASDLAEALDAKLGPQEKQRASVETQMSDVDTGHNARGW